MFAWKDEPTPSIRSAHWATLAMVAFIVIVLNLLR